MKRRENRTVWEQRRDFPLPMECSRSFALQAFWIYYFPVCLLTGAGCPQWISRPTWRLRRRDSSKVRFPLFFPSIIYFQRESVFFFALIKEDTHVSHVSQCWKTKDLSDYGEPGMLPQDSISRTLGGGFGVCDNSISQVRLWE